MESGRQKIFQTPRTFANVSCKINIKKFNTLNSERDKLYHIITIRKMYVLVKTRVLLKALLSKLCFVFHKVKHE